MSVKTTVGVYPPQPRVTRGASTGTRGLGPPGTAEGPGGMFVEGWGQQEVCTPALHDATWLPPKHLPTAPVTCLYLLRA